MNVVFIALTLGFLLQLTGGVVLLPAYLLSILGFVLIWPFILLAVGAVFFVFFWMPFRLRESVQNAFAKKNPQA